MQGSPPEIGLLPWPPDHVRWRAHSHLEREVKLHGDPLTLRQVFSSPLIQGLTAGPAVTQTLVNVYYDTPERWFLLHGLTLRVRWDGERWIQGLKSRVEPQDGVFRRWEWEQEIPSGRPVAARIADGLGGTTVAPEHFATIAPIFETRFTRLNARLEPQGRGGAVIAATFDDGAIVSGSRSEPVSELELELVSGSEADLSLLAGRLAKAFGLRPGNASKAQRGYQLADTPPARRSLLWENNT